MPQPLPQLFDHAYCISRATMKKVIIVFQFLDSMKPCGLVQGNRCMIRCRYLKPYLFYSLPPNVFLSRGKQPSRDPLFPIYWVDVHRFNPSDRTSFPVQDNNKPANNPLRFFHQRRTIRIKDQVIQLPARVRKIPLETQVLKFDDPFEIIRRCDTHNRRINHACI